MTLEEQFASSDSAFKMQVNGLTERITAELNKLEQLLLAGMVDRRLLTNFREAVNRIRLTSWNVQQSLEGGQAALPVLLLKERVRITEQLATQLTSDLRQPATEIGQQELDSLTKAIESLLIVCQGFHVEKNSVEK
jgi:hypothetical protein